MSTMAFKINYRCIKCALYTYTCTTYTTRYYVIFSIHKTLAYYISVFVFTQFMKFRKSILLYNIFRGYKL